MLFLSLADTNDNVKKNNCHIIGRLSNIQLHLELKYCSLSGRDNWANTWYNKNKISLVKFQYDARSQKS